MCGNPSTGSLEALFLDLLPPQHLGEHELQDLPEEIPTERHNPPIPQAQRARPLISSFAHWGGPFGVPADTERQDRRCSVYVEGGDLFKAVKYQAVSPRHHRKHNGAVCPNEANLVQHGVVRKEQDDQRAHSVDEVAEIKQEILEDASPPEDAAGYYHCPSSNNVENPEKVWKTQSHELS
mmetsp:Transcript_8401/g.11741  ORF Transcript_8401/g.11741 Transcript_8401/m.11741 type:complete len:180 (+) Transcript_8401:559-1098(+)